MDIKKFGIYRAEFPVQQLVKYDNGRSIEVTGGEMHGAHRCVVLAVDPNNQFAVVAPLTSAQLPSGSEKWVKVPKSWLRVTHQGKAAYILTEQVRYIDAQRVNAFEDWLGEYDQTNLEGKVKTLFGM